ncbi:MAG TPA: hypothetical protein VM529_25950 [Gemmata sp.]|nr:hypothetical protein [Gemmata sp.]
MTRVCVLVAFTALACRAPAGDAGVPEVEALRKKVQRPAARDLAWREIPWYDEAAAALAQAREEKRPLFVWLSGGRDRDGSPLERC